MLSYGLDRLVAVRAVRGGKDDRLADRQAVDADVQEAADDRAEDEDGNEEHARDRS